MPPGNFCHITFLRQSSANRRSQSEMTALSPPLPPHPNSAGITRSHPHHDTGAAHTAAGSPGGTVPVVPVPTAGGGGPVAVAGGGAIGGALVGADPVEAAVPSFSMLSNASSSATLAPTNSSVSLAESNSASSSATSLALSVKCPALPDLVFTLLVPMSSSSAFTSPPPGTVVVPFSFPGVTVADLKKTLSEKFPGKPPASSQRLIASGKLLLDDQLLGNIFSRKADFCSPHVIHLVVSSALNTSVPAPVSIGENSAMAGRNPPTVSSATSSAAPILNSWSPIPVGFNPAFTPVAASLELPISMNAVETTEALRSVMADMVAQYQTLLEQRLQLVRVNPQVVYINGNAYRLELNAPGGFSPQQFAFASTPADVQLPPAQNFVGVQPRFTLANFAQLLGRILQNAIGPEGEDDDELDDEARNVPPNPFWLIVKLSFVVAIFSQGATPSRSFTLYIAALVIFLAQMGYLAALLRFFRVVRTVPALAPVGRPVEQAQIDAGRDNIGNGEERVETRPGEGAPPVADPNPPVHVPPQSLIDEMIGMARAFVASLVPENFARPA
ncbi:hypothetical protein DFJ73DRAFT_462384 [Zopfochytrium polystomum]|nr:hypothetical protein DFJ73DRAFT_462384 [Zopfochytrium polystomum]